MEFIQDLLTAAINFTALAGFGGIALHAIYKQHAKIAAIYAEVPHATAAPKPQIEPDAEPDAEVDTALESSDIPPQLQVIADSEAIATFIESDIWEAPIASSPARYWVRQQPQQTLPVLMLMPAKEEAKPVAPTRVATQKSQQPLDINLSSLDSAALRKLCSKHGIQWRDARGKGKHLTKAAMVFQLEQKAAA